MPSLNFGAKNLIVVAPCIRSGSTPVSEMLAYYLERTQGHIYLSEYLDLNCRGYRWQNQKLVVDLHQWNDHYSETRTAQELIHELDLRVSHIQTSHDRYLLKAFPHQLPRYEKWFFETCDVIFLFRRNYFEHLLSYIISRETGLYYEPNGIFIQPASLTATRKHVDNFCKRIREYSDLRARYSQFAE